MFWLKQLALLLALNGLVAGVVLPKGGEQSPAVACKANQKAIGTAMDMYATDWSGHYPPLGKAQLTPRYLDWIPECPVAGTDTYALEQGVEATYNTQSYQDYYFIRCVADNHSDEGLPAGYPQYHGIAGVMYR